MKRQTKKKTGNKPTKRIKPSLSLELRSSMEVIQIKRENNYRGTSNPTTNCATCKFSHFIIRNGKIILQDGKCDALKIKIGQYGLCSKWMGQDDPFSFNV